VFIAGEQLGVQSGLSTSDEHIPPLLRVIIDGDDQTVECVQAELQGLFVASADDLGVHAVFDEAFGVFEELAGEDGDCGCAE